MTTTLLSLLFAGAALALALLWVLRARQREALLPFDGVVRRHLNVPYVSGPKAHRTRHRLDVYHPDQPGKRFPVIVFVHGGGWMVGHKSWAAFGQYDKIGETLARLGAVVVTPNYRLSPWVKHPDHVRDVASAVAWALANAGTYGGDAKKLFVGGHSAGGHLAALLAMDGQYLRGVGSSPAALRGCFIVSGVFQIGDFVARLARLPVAKYFGAMGPAFGSDAETRRLASPLSHVSAAAPPLLVLYGDAEWYGLRDQAEAFVQAARDAGADVEAACVTGRNHLTTISRARTRDDPVIDAIARFVAAHK